MRRLLNKFFPLGTKRRNFLFKTKRLVKKLCIGIYRIIPFKSLKKILKKSANKIGMYNNQNEVHAPYSDLRIYDKYNKEYLESKELNYTNAKIAVHLHLYYKDLLDEMISYLNNIPFKFDLYVSVVDKNNNKEIEKKLKQIEFVSNVQLEITKNSGRDYGPMMVAFGQKLKKYDYVGHIHTKKSLRMGASQDHWRLHLLNGILGSKKLVKNIFYLFEKYNIGIFFPDSVESAPYWANTWMGAASIGRKTLAELGIPFRDEYQDFSVGSMFWVNVKAAKQVFNYKWSYDDFGEEEGLNDGTLAYVFERIFVIASNYNGYDFLCYNNKKNIIYRNYSERNMDVYYEKNVDNLFNRLKDYDIVSFDIFDTLITRKIYSPDDIFKLMEKDIKDSILKNRRFIDMRKQSEIAFWNDNNKEPTIHDIYDKFSEIFNISKEDSNNIKELEIKYEKKFLIPRKDMLDLYNKLLENKKKIIIISDMYLTSDILMDILKNCGYKKFDKLYVSCELNLRKDKGNIWEYIKNKYKNKRLIHIGDNEESDIHKLWDYDVANEHIMQGKKMFENSSYGYLNKNIILNKNVVESILNGLIINKKLFNSPFKFNKNKNEFLIENLNEFGYSIVGPIILKYLLWIIKNYDKETLLFLTREGYYFKKIFDILCKNLNKKDIDATLFTTSRRCVTLATAKGKEDIYDLLNIEYYGDIKNLLFYRFGLDYKGKNFAVTLCNGNQNDNKDEVIKVIDKYMDKILERANYERKNYLNYINKLIPNIKNKKLCVVDLGYSGTTQLYLSNLLNTKVAGKYMVVKNEPKPLKIGCKVESCFNELYNDNNDILYKNSLFLECFLTAPTGQLMYFDNELIPQYIKEQTTEKKFESLNQIYDGVVELVEDMLELCGNQLLENEISKESLINNYMAFLQESNNFINKNIDIFTFEDYYCRNEKWVISKL